MQFDALLSETYFGATIAEYLLFSAAIIGGAVLGKTLNFLYERRLKKKAEATETKLDDVDTAESAAYFWDYGDMALKIRLTYYIEDIDRRKEIRSEVNLKLQKALEEAGLKLAVPIKPVRLNQTTAPRQAAGTGG